MDDKLRAPGHSLANFNGQEVKEMGSPQEDQDGFPRRESCEKKEKATLFAT